MNPRQHSQPSQRQLRVGEALRHALAEVMARGDMRDPSLRGVTITVTEVRVSPDLRNATVFVMPLGGEQVADVLDGLKRARGFFRGQVARMVDVRFIPSLTFEADRSFENARRIDELLREGHTRDGTGDDDGGA